MNTNADTPIIPGYQLRELLYAGSKTRVYRAIQQIDQLPVVIKILTSEYPSFNELLQFRNQYTISKNLKIPGIIQPLSLETYGSGYILVMADQEEISLREYIKTTTLPLAEFLAIALQLTNILHHLHQKRVIHKDIKPANILINPQTKQVQLIDFSIASLLPKETQEIKNPNVLEGTLAYISPEQTGRMNRGIDYRSDFYSLGVTFYELLTGELPFICDAPMELVHCHLAQLASYVSDIKPEIPTVISKIINKLLAKNAEDRYQSALGLQHDFEICSSQLKDTGKITDFEIGQRDVCDRFLIPEKLYGREAEVQRLLDAFERVTNGTSEIMLVAGFSGIGKTAVVNEIHKPITRQHGYFIKGKFDQFNRNIPFSAFVQSFRNLMGQLLCESDTQLQTWKTQILAALGENAQVIIEVIPELERIIGEQPPAPELSSTAAQNRFNLLFQKFLQVFTTPEHPLVIFLDDLQWADLASLKLIHLLMGELQTEYLLLIGAYRDNEVFPAHPLMLTLHEVSQAGATLNSITLQPLSVPSLNQLVADTLNCAIELAQPLTKLVYQKTQGNPFFATQFLKALYQKQLITFDAQAGYWQCDITSVRDAALTDDVVELMAQQLQRLPVETQAVLKLAACIGNQFDLSTLAIVSEQSPTEVATTLWKALQQGLILPQSDIYKFYLGDREANQHTPDEILNYRFLHDRVQQAAYSLIPEVQKQVTHLQIGRLLLQGLSPQERIEQIFEIVNQLNLGRGTISDAVEKQQLAQLNLQAGQKAKLSAAYQAAQNYYDTGMDLLTTEVWQTNYTLMYALHREGSETAYLCSHFDRAEALYAVTLAQAQTPLDKAVVYRIQMTQYQLQGRNAEAIAIQIQALHLLGLTMPTEPEMIQAGLDTEIATVEQFLEQHTIESILAAPKMQDPYIAEMLRILQILFYAAWLDGQSTLALLAVAKMTTLSLQYGNSDMSPFGYGGYSMIANTVLKDFATAHRFGEMAVHLCEQFDNADVGGMTNFLFAADIHSWSRPIREADTYYENAYKYSMEAGNWLTVSFMMMQSGSDRLTYGKNLDDLYAIAQNHAAFLAHIKSLDNLDALRGGVIQPIRHLLGLTKTPFTFDDDSFSEAQYLQKYKHSPYNLSWLYSVKIRHAYLFNQQVTYSDLIPQLSMIENTIATHAKVPSSVFYVALMHLALAETATEDAARQKHWQAFFPLEERLNFWAKACPENIQHKCLLIQAEKARLNQEKITAIELYDQAITQAHANAYGYEEGLANELAAKFYLNWGKEKIAAVYMQEAYYCYSRWGAKAKTDQLEQLYPNLLRPIFQQAASTSILETLNIHKVSIHSSTTSILSSGTSINLALDFATILKASQSLSSKIQLDELLYQLTQIIVQNSGGDGCALILPDRNGEWQVKAIATTETTELYSQPLEGNPNLPVKLIQYVKNTQEIVMIDELKTDLPVIDQYLYQQNPKSVLCLPILNQGNLVGILFLKNSSTSRVFRDRIPLLNFLCNQAAIALENAHLYQQSQSYAQQLEQSLQILQTTQKQLLRDEHILQKQALALLQLSQSKAINQGHLSEAFQEITEVTAETLETERISVWLIDEHQSKIKCVNLYQRSLQEHSQGFELQVADYPAYFLAVKSQPIIAADDALTDPRTCEFNNGYADVFKISSMLDSRIQLDGDIGGIICCEHVGEKRSWTSAEQNFISSMSNLIALALESNQRQHKTKQLNEALLDLKQSQLQIVQNEKMASLGNLVAGVAHEVNNPIGFLNGSIKNAKEYIHDLMAHIELYQQYYPQPVSAIQENAQDIDLAFLMADLPKLLDAMIGANNRIKSISNSLRTFSRADTDYKVTANLHEGLDSTLLILKYRLKANEHRPAIIIQPEYGNIPPIKCFPGQLNQVFMNILANAIDMFDEMAQTSTLAELQAHPQQITISTEAIANQVYIKIRDNGKGISTEVQGKIFDHLFTTKGVGKGTGLGLAIARQIVEERHGGTIEVNSILEKGTEFVISIPIKV